MCVLFSLSDNKVKKQLWKCQIAPLSHMHLCSWECHIAKSRISMLRFFFKASYCWKKQVFPHLHLLFINFKSKPIHQCWINVIVWYIVVKVSQGLGYLVESNGNQSSPYKGREINVSVSCVCGWQMRVRAPVTSIILIILTIYRYSGTFTVPSVGVTAWIMVSYYG